jgi:KipI family sensor histidine kinase inhibitor
MDSKALTDTPEIVALGLDSLIIRFSLVPSDQTIRIVQDFQRLLEAAKIVGLRESATALASVIVTFDRIQISRDAMIDTLRDLFSVQSSNAIARTTPSRIWHIPVAFGGDYGPQLHQASEMVGFSEKEAVENITNADLSVLSIGFAPGQPYIGLLDNVWNIPRQTELTPQVPAGALVVAVRQLVLFANPSVTGWRQVGYTAFRPFDIKRAEPFALALGDGMRFHMVSHNEMAALDLANDDGLGGARCEVVT